MKITINFPTDAALQEWFDSVDEQFPTDRDEELIPEAFEAVFGREPDEDEKREGLWSHICSVLA